MIEGSPGRGLCPYSDDCKNVKPHTAEYIYKDRPPEPAGTFCLNCKPNNLGAKYPKANYSACKNRDVI